MKTLFRVGALVIAAAAQTVCFAGNDKGSLPNILVIMCDDVGFSDIGCYGGEIPTPNIDALAKDGVRFTQFYNTARCCPSRASLLTGLYPHQAGIGHMLEATSRDGYQDHLSTDCVTIAEVLKQAGYQTYMTGKWHVGEKVLPLDRGFDRFYGTVNGGANYFDPALLMKDRASISPVTDPEYKPENYYYTDAITDNSIKFLKDHQEQSPKKPFFLYVAYTAAHWPIQAPVDEIAKHKGRYDAGYDAIRKARFEKMKQLGIINGDLKWSDTVGTWDAVDNKKREARLMEVYAAMMTRMDTGIGKITDTLKVEGELDNTLIMFLHDNGACAKELRSKKKAGTKSPGEAVMNTAALGTTVTDSHLAYGENWANVSNTPFRKYKIWTYEGGIATPLIVHWPAGLAPELKNKFIREPSHLIDIMATAVDVAGTTYPAYFEGKKIAPLAGKSLLPLLQDKAFDRGEPIFWEHEKNRAVRDGRWKLVKAGKGPWELYDMDVDRAEINNVAAKHPERVNQMADQWERWAEKNDVLPLGGWKKATGSNAKAAQTED